ncbi:hypothetical protein D910_02096 [Dendroctonus ponderosae]|uniref:Uncharacterized protein n=1 Tax=Dendroctonus ponderosae TaxID=77166 RepID=U4TT19_DENPD|nr:hypothetical protein D910_02096 [Dendroctonus ponderosae]
MLTKTILIWAAILLTVFISTGNCRLTEKQVAAAVKLVRNMCMGKSKVNPEDIEKMHQGNWDVDYEAQCYMWCGFNMYKMLDKENHFDKKSALQQMEQLPIDLQDYVIKCMGQCENAGELTNFDDKCVVAFEYSKCLYFCDPEKYFLP